jgi:2,3-bisphosphoglycerate-independent phosphoglycerate mutase
MSINQGGGSLSEAVRRAYDTGQEDERLEPMVRVDVAGRPVGRIGPGDSVIFYDVRGEREVTITRSLTEPERSPFPSVRLDLNFVTLIEYAPSLRVRAAFPPERKLRHTLTEVLGAAGFRVRKIAESEKATHVGFFFNGKADDIFPGEERIIVPSPRVEQYAERPEMSAAELAGEIISRLGDDFPQAIVANVANVDEVGHLEDREAVIKAVRTVDGVLGSVIEAARAAGATVVVTADHGSAEEWLYPDGTVDTGHTKNPVPFVLLDFAPDAPAWAVRERGGLADVAPTILELVGVPAPADMTGRSLIERKPAGFQPRRKLLLLLLDGWGHREEAYGNLIREAGPANFERIWRGYPRSVLDSSGQAVGMPPGTVGNSEAGHLHLGAGRLVFLDRVRVDRAIEDGSFFRNETLLWAMNEARSAGRALHLMGIVSFYSSHGTIRHLFALMRMARESGVKKLFIHSFIGRRNDMPETGAVYIEKVEDMARELGVGVVATVMGRYWPLARANTPDRVEKAYRALVHGEGIQVSGNFSS